MFNLAHPAGFDEERSDEVREHRRPQGEKRRATRKKIPRGDSNRKKVKKEKRRCKFTCKSRFALFYRDFLQKKWYTRRDSNPRPSTPEADALSS